MMMMASTFLIATLKKMADLPLMMQCHHNF
jgi:hypothetical protein